MNDELPLKKPRTKNRHRLEERLAQRPELLERLHEIVDTLEQSVADGCDAHDAEDRVVDEIRKLGQTVLGQWAQEAHASVNTWLARRKSSNQSRLLNGVIVSRAGCWKTKAIR